MAARSIYTSDSCSRWSLEAAEAKRGVGIAIHSSLIISKRWSRHADDYFHHQKLVLQALASFERTTIKRCCCYTVLEMTLTLTRRYLISMPSLAEDPSENPPSSWSDWLGSGLVAGCSDRHDRLFSWKCLEGKKHEDSRPLASLICASWRIMTWQVCRSSWYGLGL